MKDYKWLIDNDEKLILLTKKQYVSLDKRKDYSGKIFIVVNDSVVLDAVNSCCQ